MGNDIQKICKHHGLTTHRLKSRGVGVIKPVCKVCKINSNRKRIRENKIKLVQYKGGCCEECGYNQSMTALHFHHNDPSTKSFSLSERSDYSYARLQAEADKCALLCANCHSERHEEEIFSMKSLTIVN